MNIWHWIEQLQASLREAGQAHSADLIDRFSSEICDQEVERAEALMPELRALCKTLENPWLEVFVRHWDLRNRLGNKSEGETALAETVALFEFAHRDDYESRRVIPSIKVDADSRNIEELPQSIVLMCRGSNEYAIDGVPVEGTQAQIDAAIADAVALRVGQNPDLQGIVSCDTKAEVGSMVHLIDLLRDNGVKKYAIATEKPEPAG
jgi:biopolymer transport protein ExbD